MKEIVFDSKVMPDGHLYCPEELARRKNAKFKVIVSFEEPTEAVTEQEMESAAVVDSDDDFLSDEEVDYYLNLEEL